MRCLAESAHKERTVDEKSIRCFIALWYKDLDKTQDLHPAGGVYLWLKWSVTERRFDDEGEDDSPGFDRS